MIRRITTWYWERRLRKSAEDIARLEAEREAAGLFPVWAVFRGQPIMLAMYRPADGEVFLSRAGREFILTSGVELRSDDSNPLLAVLLKMVAEREAEG